MTISPEKLSPLQFIQYQSLHELSKSELVEVCMGLIKELGQEAVSHIDSVKKRAEGKKASHKRTVTDKVKEVYIDLMRNGQPSPAQMEISLNSKYGPTTWVYNQYVKADKANGEHGFYRIFLKLNKEFGFS